MGRAICRLGDRVTGTCTASGSGHPRTFTGTWTTCSSKITCDGIGVIRVGDTGKTDCNHNFVAIEGSSIAREDGSIGLVRVGDAVRVIEGGSGVCQTGSPVGTSD